MKAKPYILPTIILSQFACTSSWFAGNAIADELIAKTGLGTEIIGYVLSSVQLGFITGTLIFGLFMIADRFSPSKVFLVCAVLVALCNLLLLSEEITTWVLLTVRFGTGFFLAGIYPIGMKIAADYYEKGLGKALGYLVGALVFGTALPYLVRGTTWGNNPVIIIKTVAALAIIGGLCMFLFVPNGPFRKPSQQLHLNAASQLFKIPSFRNAAFGYFGHMWELYAFWAFTPFALETFNALHNATLKIPFWTGIIIILGGVSCSLGGVVAQKIGSKNVASFALTISGIFCLLSPFLFGFSSFFFLLGWCVWGMAVAADSPQFSNLVAQASPPELKGTGLTLVSCIGFALTIVSIQLLSFLANIINPKQLFILLSLGPILGLIALKKRKLFLKLTKKN